MHDEYKVMGLAAYGEDRFADGLSRMMAVDARGSHQLDLSYFSFHTHGRNRWHAERMREVFGPPRAPDEPLTDRHRDIACSVQRALERCGLALARHAFAVSGVPNLCISGGVGQNVCLNARIAEETPFRSVFVPPAPSDAGTAHGAIQAVRAKEAGWRRPSLPHAYLGPAYSRAECAAALARHGLTWTEAGDDTAALVTQLTAGHMVGFYQGRMEFGPRALGARSILADPRRLAARDRLNATIKRREEFRPFAPAVPEERAAEYFVCGPPSPFMSFVVRVRPEKRALIPAVVHVDATARLQTVRREDNPLFWQLLMDFGAATGVPVLLNTSFNENEPIVCSPDEAIACFLRTPLDALFLEGLLVVKEAAIAASAG
jgi:carbamoyltransferase